MIDDTAERIAHREAGIEVPHPPEWKYEHAIEPGLYRHYQGGYYDVLHVGTDVETGDAYVVCRAVEFGRIWLCAARLFEEIVAKGMRRFERVIG